MTRSEQKRMIQDLKYYTRTMSREDLEKFHMLEKRDKDDEDLDSRSAEALELLHRTYLKTKSRSDAEEAWKKLTSKGKSD